MSSSQLKDLFRPIGSMIRTIAPGGRARRCVALFRFLHDEWPHPSLVPKSPPTIRQQNHSGLTLVRRRSPALVRGRGSSHIDSVSTSRKQPRSRTNLRTVER